MHGSSIPQAPRRPGVGVRYGLMAGAAIAAGAIALSSGMPDSPALAQRADAPSVMTPMGRAPLSFADIAEKVKPAVVSISVSSGSARVSQRSPRPNDRNAKPFPGLPDEFNEFFRNLPRDFGGNRTPQMPRRSQALGSGFFISEDGYVVTNNHVIDKAEKI